MNLDEARRASIAAEDPGPANQPKSRNPGEDLVELCDERCNPFLKTWLKQGLVAPVVGFELTDGKERVCAQAELAWPYQKLAAVFSDQADDRKAFEQNGWKVFDADDLSAWADEIRSHIKDS